MRIFPALTSIALGATALVAALALSTPAGACFVVGPGPTFTVPSFPNSSLSPPCPPPAGAFSTFAAAVAFSNAQLALLSPSPVSPSPVSPFPVSPNPVSPGGLSSPPFPSVPNSGDGFRTATDALNFGNAAPGSDVTARDFEHAAMQSRFNYHYDDENRDGLDDATGETYASFLDRSFEDQVGRVRIPGSNVGQNNENDPGLADNDNDGLPDNDQDVDGYDDYTGEFLYSTLVEDIDRDRDGVIDDDQNPACGGGACDVAGFLDDLSGQSCDGGSCDVGDIFSSMVNVTDSGRISGFTLIEGGCGGGDCGAGESADRWPNVMVQVLDLDGIRNPAGRTVEPMHIEGSGGDDPLDLGNDFFANPAPPVAAGRRDTPQETGRFPVIVSYESLSEALDRAVADNGPGLANRARVILDNTDDPNSSSGGGIFIPVVPLTIENTTISGNTAGGQSPPVPGGPPMTGGNINVPEVQLTDAQFQGVINGTIKLTKAGAPR